MPYDIVILDEAGMTRRHFCASDSGMSDIAMECLQRMKQILVKAKHVIVMQYMLTERDVGFYTSLCGMDLYDPNIYSVRFRYSNYPPVRIMYSHCKWRVVAELMQYLRLHGGVKPVAVMCSSKRKSAPAPALWLMRRRF